MSGQAPWVEVERPGWKQVAHALGLLAYAWALRRVLREKPSRAPSIGLVIPGADAVAVACGLGWPAAAVGIVWSVGVAWTISSKEGTRNLIALIKATRSSKAPPRSSTRTRLSPSVTVRAGTRCWPGANRGSLRDSHPRTTPNSAGQAAYPLTWANSELALFRLWRRPAAAAAGGRTRSARCSRCPGTHARCRP